jgi:ribosome-associated protein
MSVRVTDAIVIPADELAWSFARSGGPGGQNVNKVASKVELRWTPATSRAIAALSEETRAWLLSRLAGRLTLGGELLVTSSLTRDQIKNRADAAEKLAGIVRAALARPKKRKATRPTRASKERRIGAKRRRSEIKRARRGDE